MRRLPLGRTVVLPFAASLAGCYWLASYQDLTSGLGGDASAEGASDEDAGDSGAEGAPLPDVSSEGAAVVEAGPFCPDDAGPLVYCMDFDGVDASTLGLYTYEANASIVDDISVSPPSSFFVQLDGPDVGTGGGYTANLPFTPTSSRLEFQMYTSALSGEVTTMGLALYVASTQTWESLQVLVSPTGALQVQEYIDGPDGGTGYGHVTYPADGGLTPANWHHVVLTLTVNDSTQQYFSGLTVDGQVVEAQTTLQAIWAEGTAHVNVGSSWCRVGGSRIYYDNVRADFTL